MEVLTMYRLYTNLFDTPTIAGARRWAPATDLVEHEDHYLVTADLPGLKPEDVTIDVSDGVLTISGERSIDREAKDGGYVRVERASGSFVRSLRLPKGTDADGIEASFEDGVLQIRVPKPVAVLPKRIEIAAKSAA
jgi:HSP20 family protein